MNSPKRISLFLILSLLALGCAGGLPNSNKEYRVKQVIDGDTIELDGGERVRYLGLDTPETRKRQGETWVYAPQPYAEKAKEFNRQLVEGRFIRLEFDIQKRDKYNRLLAYCFVGDTFVNARILEEGLALLYTSSPNVKYVDLLVKKQQEARQNNRGIWGEIQVIAPKDAQAWLNQIVTVEGRVSSLYQSSKVSILNFSRSKFKAVIFKDDYPVFMSAGVSLSSYKGKTVRLSGKVREYKDNFEIIVRHPSSIEVMD